MLSLEDKEVKKIRSEKFLHYHLSKNDPKFKEQVFLDLAACLSFQRKKKS